MVIFILDNAIIAFWRARRGARSWLDDVPAKTITAHLPFDLSQSMLTPFLARHRSRVLKLGSFAVLDINDSFIAQITFVWPGSRLYTCADPIGATRV